MEVTRTGISASNEGRDSSPRWLLWRFLQWVYNPLALNCVRLAHYSCQNLRLTAVPSISQVLLTLTRLSGLCARRTKRNLKGSQTRTKVQQLSLLKIRRFCSQTATLASSPNTGGPGRDQGFRNAVPGPGHVFASQRGEFALGEGPSKKSSLFTSNF